MPVDPAQLRILLYPADALRAKATEVQATDEVRTVARRMLELMRGAEGIGLAAPQVGLSWRLFVCDVPPGEEWSADTDPPSATRGPQIWINPRVVEHVGPVEPYEEGCLSLPGIRGEVNRPGAVAMEALNERGEKVRVTASGLLARCWQHEIDHLDGVLILDRMTQTGRLRNRSRVKAMEKSGRR